MPTNAFEDSRIAEGTLHTGAQHVANLTPKVTPPPAPALPGEEVLDGHRIRVEQPGGRRILGATTLTGAGVRNPAGQSLGKIEDIMIDIPAGRIAYAVLSSGGLFGIGNKLFVLPWSALTFDQRQNEFIVDIQREVVERGPGFDKNNWPDMADPAWGANIYKHYGKTPYW